MPFAKQFLMFVRLDLIMEINTQILICIISISVMLTMYKNFAAVWLCKNFNKALTVVLKYFIAKKEQILFA